jgi:hypothetical protein
MWAYNEIIAPVICLDFIDVMNVRAIGNISAERAFGDKGVLIDIAIPICFWMPVAKDSDVIVTESHCHNEPR